MKNQLNFEKLLDCEKQELKRIKIKRFSILLLIVLVGFCFVFANFSENQKEIILNEINQNSVVDLCANSAINLSVDLGFNTNLEMCANVMGTNLSIEDDLKNETDNQLGFFDFSDLDEELDNIENNESFGASSFVDKVKALINGDYSFSFQDIFSIFLSTFVLDLKNLVPFLASIFSLAILSNIVGHFKTKTSKNLSNVIHFVCYSAVIIVVCSMITNLVNITTNAINSMQNQMEVIFPIVLTLMASVGNTVSVGIYQPIMAMLSGLIINVFSYIIIPIFLISFVLSVVGNLSNNVKLNKFSSLLNDVFKWIIGAVFTVFTGVMAIKGISAGSFDSVSIRTTKYALKTYIPLVGGYLSDGFNLIMASSVLIKNAVGTAGLLLIFLSVLSPVIMILVFKWSLHLLSAVLEPLMDDRISNFLYSVSKAMNMLIASILCVALMYLISVGLLMTSGNVYWGWKWML